jgi:hypothetical protein
VISDKNIKRGYWVALFFAIIYIYYTTGKKIDDSAFAVISGSLFIAWLIYVFVFTNPIVFKIINNKKYFLFFIIFSYHFLIGGLSTTILKQLIYSAEFLLVFAPIIIYDYFKQVNSKKIFLSLVFFILLTFSVYSFKTIFYLIDDPMAARSMVSSDKDQNVAIGGGFALAYGLAILVPCLFYILIRQKKYLSKINNAFLIGCIILFSITVFVSLFTISIVGMISGCLFVFFLKENKKILVVFLKVFIIGALFYSIIGPVVGNYLIESDIFSNPILKQRSDEIAHILIGNQVSGTEDLSARVDLYNKSFNTFSQYPFFGVYHKAGNDYENLYAAGIGGHSDLLDYLGKYGLFGCCLIFYFLYLCYKDNGSSILLSLAWLIFIFFAILNPIISFTIFLVLFLLIPSINNLLLNNTKTKAL